MSSIFALLSTWKPTVYKEGDFMIFSLDVSLPLDFDASVLGKWNGLPGLGSSILSLALNVAIITIHLQNEVQIPEFHLTYLYVLILDLIYCVLFLAICIFPMRSSNFYISLKLCAYISIFSTRLETIQGQGLSCQCLILRGACTKPDFKGGLSLVLVSMRHTFYPWVRKIHWRRKWQLIQYSCLGNPMDRGAWRAIVPGVTKSWTQLKIHTHTRRSLVLGWEGLWESLSLCVWIQRKQMTNVITDGSL